MGTHFREAPLRFEERERARPRDRNQRKPSFRKARDQAELGHERAWASGQEGTADTECSGLPRWSIRIGFLTQLALEKLRFGNQSWFQVEQPGRKIHAGVDDG